MVSKQDSKPILIKFPVGTSDDEAREKVYQDDWNIVYALIRNPSGSNQAYVYGQEQPFDKLIVVNAGSLTRMIDYDTAILIDEMPTEIVSKGDYSVSYIYPEYNGEIVIGLNKKEAIKFPRLYFYSNGNLLYSQMNFDKQTKQAFVNKRQTVPFEVNSYVWTREPSSEADTSYRLVVSQINPVGFNNFYKPFKSILFVEE